ncbi:iron-siderophore ABC transporter substrate-binding protein [Brevibacterium aurantiacum]|uniref:Iron ABC transporter substrate-binding protein n=1 Tax=Brevibacterium aurantiacum TaxID=273384 RepID=A0A2A3ZN28_BREAU|nr:iron-siderophore ABC transporter substrate-binding protein [Brevibacterium aurantiacum]MDN5593053.1 iron-siderophore ABC transporter substrate-binding protein [Brevibacterium sp.]MDN5710950.1 iron-siderophore ABC transporter substrate-binding protein [Brevibacterium aurantiacum]MDN5734745.1 iron-siderophore ABC transporter substrate-binding protein [Brevibacterium aurantiacum]MDN5791437.1 iron-siderophore ABC transporter substrate-binding protein [Brevibacterium aurantiacum]PCC53382.1 iron 
MSAHLTRRAMAIGTIVTLAFSASACSQDSADSAKSASDDFQTVTIEHALGKAVIEAEPKRVVTLGQGSTETAIALGKTPVGMEEYAWGSDDTGYMPWIHEAVTEKGEELPKQFQGDTELDVEAIAELEPDVILAPWSGVTADQYKQLDAIAPTVAYPKQPWTIEWDEQITTIGKALGQEKESEGLVDDIKTQLSEAKRPEYEGLTFSYIYNDGPGTLGVFYPNEQRVAMVSALGLTPDPVVDELKKNYDAPGTDSALIGLENADKLDDSDLIFTFYSDEKSKKEIKAQSVYANIPAIKSGAVVAPEDQPFVTASSIINPLTVPWTLERYVPMIDKAAENVKK